MGIKGSVGGIHGQLFWELQLCPAELWLPPCLLPWKMGCFCRSCGVPAPGCRVRVVCGSSSGSRWIFLEEEPRRRCYHLAEHTCTFEHLLFMVLQRGAAPGWATGALGHPGGLFRQGGSTWVVPVMCGCLNTAVLRCWRRPSKSLRVTLTSHWSSWRWKTEPQQRYGEV